MDQGTILQGRTITTQDIEFIRQLIAARPDWHRTRLSQELCRQWDWTNAKGAAKDMAARAVLRKLDSRGLISLPAPVRSASSRSASLLLSLRTTPVGS